MRFPGCVRKLGRRSVRCASRGARTSEIAARSLPVPNYLSTQKSPSTLPSQPNDRAPSIRRFSVTRIHKFIRPPDPYGCTVHVPPGIPAYIHSAPSVHLIITRIENDFHCYSPEKLRAELVRHAFPINPNQMNGRESARDVRGPRMRLPATFSAGSRNRVY